MKTPYAITVCASLAFLVVAIFGCEPDEPRIPPDGEQMTVRVYVYADTLLEFPCLPHAATPGFAIARDRGGRVMGGVIVDLAVTPPELGCIEYADSALRDTTNDQGRVEFYFHSNGSPGDAIITATVGYAFASCSLHIVTEADPPVESITVSAQWDTVWIAPGLPDSAWIRVCLRDSTGAGIPNCSIPLHDASGHLSPFFLTDSTGCARVWWHPPCCGVACVTFSVMQSHDMTACVFVDSL